MCKQLARSRSVWAGSLIAFVISAVSGCGLVDSVGPRGVHYNDEIADAKSGAILLNIIRAAYSMPLQFTDFSQYLAGASAGGTLAGSTGAGIPVPLNHLANLMPRTATVSPNISLNGSLNATTSTTGVNLNTQEFYQGLIKPLSNKQIHSYLTKTSTSLEDWQLLTLFISNITVGGTPNFPDTTSYHKTLYGRADTPDNFYTFTASIIRLVEDYGLTMQKVPASAKPVGPQLAAFDVAYHPELLAALVTSSTAEKPGVTLSSADIETEAECMKARGVWDAAAKKCSEEKLFQLKAPGADSYEFCFASKPKRHVALSTDFRTLDKDPVEIDLFPTAMGDHLISQFKATNKCGFKKPEKIAREKIIFSTRSLEGIFYFLGEMVRTELGLGPNGIPTSLEIPLYKGDPTYRLFSVKQRRPSAGEIGVKFKGQWFSVEVDPTGQYDSSSRVLQILADLWALQSKAKDFPSPNVVTVANP